MYKQAFEPMIHGSTFTRRAWALDAGRAATALLEWCRAFADRRMAQHAGGGKEWQTLHSAYMMRQAGARFARSSSPREMSRTELRSGST